MITLKKDFTEEQEKIAKKLGEELIEGSHELEEFGNVSVYGLKEEEGNMSVLFEIDYSDPEQDGKLTIYGNY